MTELICQLCKSIGNFSLKIRTEEPPRDLLIHLNTFCHNKGYSKKHLPLISVCPPLVLPSSVAKLKMFGHGTKIFSCKTTKN